MSNLVAMYQNLKQVWNQKPPDLDKCGEMLEKLKVGLLQVQYLPIKGEYAIRDLLLARDILEIAVHWSVAKNDISAFERYMSQLKVYYMDYKNLPESSFKYELLGLNLLRLLALNKLADFHTELELLSMKELHENLYIRHPVSIEQYLMEGSYNKVYLLRDNVPAQSYKFFVDMLLDTIRDEIATCMEKAYEKIAFSEASRMLFYQSQNPLKDYAAQRGWKLDSDSFFHFTPEEKNEGEFIPSLKLAEQAIDYARELEMII